MYLRKISINHCLAWLGICLPALVLATAATGATPGLESTRMWITVGQQRFAVTLANNPSTQALAQQLPLTLDMNDLNSNEKMATLAQPLPTDTFAPGTINTGDLLLYGTDTLVVFYKTFSSAYSYSRLGRIDNPAGLVEALGRGDVRVVFSAD